LDHRVKVIRLGPADRRALTTGERELGALMRANARFVPQRELAGGEWRLDVTPGDRRSLRAFERHPTVWHHVETSRGAEISKHGRALACPGCGLAAPAPRGAAAERTCPHCRAVAPLAEFRSLRIVRTGVRERAGWVPLVAGEDVQRYVATPSRCLRLGVEGIAYKERSSGRRRLVVRKTGLGLNVAVLPPGVRTVQTVYEFWARSETPAFALEYYLLGVLGSRAMLAYHLRRSGEDEWRSHPYVTQKTVLGLPVPDPHASPAMLALAGEIADGARRLTERPHDRALDLAVEQLVWQLVGLGPADGRWIADTLAGTQDQRAFTRMRLPTAA
jgi:hypothetical protein